MGNGFPIAITVSGSDLFITNFFPYEFREYTTSGAMVNALLFSPNSTPEGIAAFGSDLFITNRNTGTVDEYTTSLTAVNASLVSGLTEPEGICIEPAGPIGSPAKLAFVQQPTTAIAGLPISPPIEVAVEDSEGDVVTSDNSTVTIAAFGAGGATLSGTRSVAAVDGVATFNNLSLTAAGTYTLAVGDGGLTGVFSSPVVATVGYVDTANMNAISGWAFDPSDPTASINVEVDISGGPAQTFSADQTRLDLQPILSSTDHGFTYSTPVLSVGNHTAYIYAVESNDTKVLLATETLVSQNSLFDEHYYLAMNPDVAAAAASGDSPRVTTTTSNTGSMKAIARRRIGMRPITSRESRRRRRGEGGQGQFRVLALLPVRPVRKPAGSALFQHELLPAEQSDVAAAVTAGTVTSAFEHFVLYGQYEGRARCRTSHPRFTMPTIRTSFRMCPARHAHRISSNSWNMGSTRAGSRRAITTSRFTWPTTPTLQRRCAGLFPDGFQHWLEYGQYEGREAV